MVGGEAAARDAHDGACSDGCGSDAGDHRRGGIEVVETALRAIDLAVVGGERGDVADFDSEALSGKGSVRDHVTTWGFNGGTVGKLDADTEVVATTSIGQVHAHPVLLTGDELTIFVGLLFRVAGVVVS